MKIVILYGTESGNAERLAGDLGKAIGTKHEWRVVDLGDISPDELSVDEIHIFITSTYGDGLLGETGQIFYEALEEAGTELDGLKYAIFGLGDSSYEDTYNQGSSLLDALLSEHGATRFGEFGLHDDSGFERKKDIALAWLPGVLADAEQL
ncbi:MAG TPA: flavodoxin domain-containing protein [Plantibacter sp.]|uniref:flavodoxin domain-containing protein n=1 Tax=unclassified Plantibacter TaxID=2624265 RepID=UPI002D1B5030|nr:flavodoxin domain-containing protein [Plantibacter sp.]